MKHFIYTLILSTLLTATTCENVLDLRSISSDMKWSYNSSTNTLNIGTIGDNYWCSGCGTYTRSITFYIDGNVNINDFTLVSVGFDDWIRITINGHRVYSAPYGDYWDNVNTASSSTRHCFVACELSTNWKKYPNIQLKDYLRKGFNTIEMKVQVAGCGEGWMNFRVKASYKKSTSPICPDGFSVSNNVCVKSYTYYNYLCKNETNEFNENWQVQNSGGTSSTSPTPPTNNCKRKKFTCNSNMREPVWVDNKWQCSPFPCIGSDRVNELDADFSDNDKNNNGWDSNGGCSGQLYIFNGKSAKCRSSDELLGLTGGGCCDKDKVFLGLVSCKSNEKLLAEERKAEKAHYVGNFCSKEINLLLGSVCVQHSDSYCVFRSKLARIINEQGRSQLGISWGDAKSPNCRGFTPEEFQKLDFSKINLSEITNSLQLPNTTNLQNTIKNKIQNSLNTIQYSGN